MKFVLRFLLGSAIAFVLAGAGAYADVMTYTFSVIPAGGNVEGPPGSTVGWGYFIQNQDSTNWLVTTNLASDAFANGAPDSSIFDFPIVAPGSTATLPFDPGAGTGLFVLTWDAAAPIGFTNSGVFTLDAEWWSGDPFAGGTFIQDATEETAAYTATVAAAQSAVPEPRAWVLLATVVALLLGLLRNRLKTA